MKHRITNTGQTTLTLLGRGNAGYTELPPGHHVELDIQEVFLPMSGGARFSCEPAEDGQQ